MTDLATATALETARAVRDGAVSAVETCEAAIARIEAMDGPINAVVVRDFDRARAAAKALDSSRKPGDMRPLLGVAMTVKESIDIAGLPTTWGFPEFKTLPVREDAVVVQRLKAAGAVILGKTNAPVALADWQTVNPIYGRTVNPHDHARTPGGSSGGAAAALAAHMVPLEVGSDIGGSIRVPAHMCGVYGHKPTYGVIPLKGHGFPGTDGIDVPLAAVGPMARSADDIALAFDVLAGPVEGTGWRLDLPPARHKTLKDFRVFVLDAHPAVATDATVRDALNGLAEKLERAGAKVVRQVPDMPDLAKAQELYTQMLTTVVTRGSPNAPPVSAHAFMELQDAQMRTTRQWRTIFKDIDVMLAPTFGVPPYPHEDNPDWAARTLMIDGKATPYGAQLGWPGLATWPLLPATAAPIAKTKDGLPVGAQIVGDLYGDRTTIAFAQLLQREGLAL